MDDYHQYFDTLDNDNCLGVRTECWTSGIQERLPSVSCVHCLDDKTKVTDSAAKSSMEKIQITGFL